MIEQIKPVVVGWVQVGYRGASFSDGIVHGKYTAEAIALANFKSSGIKSKFRPVYEKAGL